MIELVKLLEKLEYTIVCGDASTSVENLVYDSRKVNQNDVFVCITGAVSDGHSYIDEVIEKGATVLIVEKDIEITENINKVTVIKVSDTRYALAYMSAAFFGYPANELFTIGVTGTKGKTTTTFMVYDILNACNIKTGLIGTIETIIGEERFPSPNTTPESYKVQEYFRKMVDCGCKCVVMEVSSQALMLHRTAGIIFDIGVFTNLEPDHIGPNEHSSLEDYISCKGLLFKQCKVGIVNADSDYLEEVLKKHTCEIQTYGINNGADFNASHIKYENKGGMISTAYDVTGTKALHVELSLPGKFSVYNSLCAVAITSHLDVDDDILERALLNAKVAGRVEPVKVSDDFVVMIDYAHNAMSLKSLLETLREYNPKRIISLFGCGGNRSKLRRFEMGEVSGKLADFTIITSDNPRFEEPKDIMADIETGIKKTDGRYIMIENRGEAIKYAIENGQPGDMIILAGKGHEDYQEIKGVKYHMTDRELVLKAIER